MKKITSSIVAGVAMLLLLALTTPAFAREVETITGEGKCGKCAMHETEKCQNVISVEKDGKTVNYYLTGKVSKEFHENLCKENKRVTATGNVKEKDGKMTMAVEKIELAK
jgi:RecG-like helicase